MLFNRKCDLLLNRLEKGQVLGEESQAILSFYDRITYSVIQPLDHQEYFTDQDDID